MPSTDPFPDRAFFDEVYKGRAPWDVGAPQPDLMALIDAFPPRGRILDLGCGTGDLAIGLAQAGHSVLAVDFVPAAVDEARARCSALPAEVSARIELRVDDALRPSRFAGAFESVVDSGFLHLFDAPTRLSFARDLAAAIPAGGLYYLLGFAVTFPIPNAPREVTGDEAAALFGPGAGWLVKASRPARFRTTGFDDVPALAFCAESLP